MFCLTRHLWTRMRKRSARVSERERERETDTTDPSVHPEIRVEIDLNKQETCEDEWDEYLRQVRKFDYALIDADGPTITLCLGRASA